MIGGRMFTRVNKHKMMLYGGANAKGRVWVDWCYTRVNVQSEEEPRNFSVDDTIDVWKE